MKKLTLFCLLSFMLCLFGCKELKELQYTGVKGFKVNKISAEGIDADILLGIKNPNNYGFSIYKSNFDVTYSGIYLGKARLTKKVHINGNAEETYSFNLKSDFKNVNLTDVIRLLGGTSKKGTLEIKGDLKAGKFYLKKKFPVDVKEKVSLD